jgi:hypothetical protein
VRRATFQAHVQVWLQILFCPVQAHFRCVVTDSLLTLFFCPRSVIYYPYLGTATPEDVQAAAGAGAAAVVLQLGAIDVAGTAEESGLEVIWDVRR